MASSVKANIEELQQIEQEIKRYYAAINKLKAKKREIEKSVSCFIEEKQLPGVKHKDLVIRLNTKVKAVSLGKTRKNEDMIAILRASGVQNPEDVISKLKGAGKTEVEKHELKISHIQG